MRGNLGHHMRDEVEQFLRQWDYKNPNWISELEEVSYIQGSGQTFRPDRSCYAGEQLSADDLFELGLDGPAAEIPTGTHEKNRYILYLKKNGNQQSLGWSTRFRLLRERTRVHPEDTNRVADQLLDQLHRIWDRRNELDREEKDVLNRLGTLLGYKK